MRRRIPLEGVAMAGRQREVPDNAGGLFVKWMDARNEFGSGSPEARDALTKLKRSQKGDKQPPSSEAT
jgi:hypothetical protein